jgi:hypothetical protein
MSEQEESQSVPQAESPHLEFPEDKIQGQGYSQFNPKTGWLWIGLKLPAFNFRTALAFIHSQEYLVSSVFDTIEGERMRKMALANPKGNGNPLMRILQTLKH